jgi:hypothetical protein
MFWLYYAGACAGANFYLVLAERARADPEAEGLLQSTRRTFQIAHAILGFLIVIAAFSLAAPPFVMLAQWWEALVVITAAFAITRVVADAVVSRMQIDVTAFYIGAGPQIAILVLALCAVVWRTSAVAAGWLNW